MPRYFMNVFILLIISTGALLFGAIIGYLFRQSLAKRQAGSIEEKIAKLQLRSKEEAQRIILEAKTRSVKLLEGAEQEIKEWRSGLLQEEKRAEKKELTLERQTKDIEEGEKGLKKEISRVKEIKVQIEEIHTRETQTLEKIARLSIVDAKEELFRKIKGEYQQELYDRLRKLEEDANDTLSQRAKELIVQAAQRYAASQVAEITTTTVTLPSDEIKGRIIGKEGRNIKALERLTGVEIIVDDTPEAVVLSAFDGVRRHIAKLALEKLVKDGRIQPAKIEEKVAEAEKDIIQEIKKAGEVAVYDVGLVGLDPKLVTVLGRLKFRTSYGQNVLMHSLEVAHIAQALAYDLGGDPLIAKQAGLFHDIGKALDHQVEGTHVDIGIKILEKFGVDKDVILAMRSHHEEYPYETLESRIVQVADIISAARPGARKDTVENYLKRLADLEGIATSFPGVEKAYAIAAGREIRVFVHSEEVDDFQTKNIARDIANKIQEELKYPGEIKVTAIRETRVVDYAR